MLFIAYTQALFHIKTSTEQKIIFISSLFFSSINYLITLFLPLCSITSLIHSTIFWLFLLVPFASFSSSNVTFTPFSSTSWPFLYISPFFLCLKCWSSAQRPSSSTAAWRRWLFGRMRSTTSCGRRSSRPTGTCGGSPMTPSTDSGAGKQYR